jgi:hypothetical protein
LTDCRDPLLSSVQEAHKDRMAELTTLLTRGYTAHLLASLGSSTSSSDVRARKTYVKLMSIKQALRFLNIKV